MQTAGTSQTSQALESAQRDPAHLGKCIRALVYLHRSAALGAARDVAHDYCTRWGLGQMHTDLLVDFAGRLPTRTFETRSAVYREGDRDDALYILLSGSVVLHRTGAGEMSELGHADLFGEVSAIHGVHRTETVVAREPVEVAIVPLPPLRAIAEVIPPVAQTVQETAHARLLTELFPAGSPFRELDDATRSVLLSRMRGRSVERGTRLVRQGHSALACFVLLSGRAETWRQAKGADRQLGAPQGPGDCFGGCAILEDGSVDYHAVASTTLTLFGIRPEDLRALAKGSPALRRALLKNTPLSSRPSRSTGGWSRPPSALSGRS